MLDFAFLKAGVRGKIPRWLSLLELSLLLKAYLAFFFLTRSPSRRGLLTEKKPNLKLPSWWDNITGGEIFRYFRELKFTFVSFMFTSVLLLLVFRSVDVFILLFSPPPRLFREESYPFFLRAPLSRPCSSFALRATSSL